MKLCQIAYRFTVCAIPLFFSPLALGQTCVAGTEASNPTSVYAIDSVNGTVTDTRTGLMWDRCPRGQSGGDCATGGAGGYTWQGALDGVATVGTYKGFNDWRLPNVRELRSLVEECRRAPSINEFAFPNTPLLFFWSGSPSAGGAANAWFVEFQDGVGNTVSRSNASGRVRLVRAGQ